MKEEVIVEEPSVEPVVEPIVEEIVEPVTEEAVPEVPVKEEVAVPVAPVVEEEPIDWLEKFRMAAKRFDEESAQRAEDETSVKNTEESAMPKESFASITEQEAEPVKNQLIFYRSRLGGLKDIAQNIDKSSRNSGMDYAFTMNAGLSLFKAIKPFSPLHVYVKSKDKDFFERILMLTPSDETNAQLCLMTSDDKKLYVASSELHGLFVVEKSKLLEDVKKYGDGELIEEAESILS
jgi:hypothetical protein